MLTISRFPDHLRTHNLPDLLCAAYATVEPRARLRLPRPGHARTGRQYLGKFEQALNEQGAAWSCVLADSHWRWNTCHHLWLLQCLRSKYTP